MTRASAALSLATFASLSPLGACKTQQSFEEPEPHLERMLEQPRVDPFQPSTFYADGMGMRTPPPGAISREQEIGDPRVVLGTDHGALVDQVPIPLDGALLARGRDRFDITCATCHGVTGDGVSVVAENMVDRKPPSLHEARIRAFPAGQLYRVIRSGYGLMPSYALQLSVEDRWAVVAYVRALELSRSAQVSALPADVRGELDKETKP